jgi:5-methylcytosine-specific restriction enzyme subunit McrC
MAEQRRIILQGNEPARLAATELEPAAVYILRQHYHRQVRLDEPAPETGGQWQLAAGDWAGLIPVSEQLLLELRPELAPAKPWHEIAGLESTRLTPDERAVVVTSWLRLYNELAAWLARKVLLRARHGLHRGYVQQSDRLPYVRGQLDMREVLRRPWSPGLESHFEEYTTDIGDNQILAWTLRLIARSDLCDDQSRILVGRAFRSLQRSVSVQPIKPQECTGRSYSRLNQDYRPLHQLCHFFLEHTGSGHMMGERAMVPFLLEVARER